MLTSKQRAHLRALANPLKAIVHIGKEGVSESALTSVLEGFNRRELLKVKVQEAAPLSAREGADALVEQLDGVECVAIVGRTIVLYRRHPDEPEIKLP